MIRAKFKMLLGVALIALGLTIGVQSLAQARDDWWNSQSTIHNNVTDMDMFGKNLSFFKVPLDFQADLKPGNGPVVPERLRIPALGIDSAIEEVGVRSNGAMDVPTNIWHSGWLKSSARPGDTGNAVIAGHRDSVRGGAVFLELGKLKAGDKIYVSDRWGWELTFEVTGVESYDPANAPLERIFGETSEKQLNLITCTGTFVPEIRTYDQRLVVYSKLVS